MSYPSENKIKTWNKNFHWGDENLDTNKTSKELNIIKYVQRDKGNHI